MDTLPIEPHYEGARFSAYGLYPSKPLQGFLLYEMHHHQHDRLLAKALHWLEESPLGSLAVVFDHKEEKVIGRYSRRSLT